MSFVWTLYLQALPFLPFVLLAGGILLGLFLLRPFINRYFLFGEQRDLLREQVKLQKKILEELQFLRSSPYKTGDFSHSSTLVEDQEVLNERGEEEPIQIELKKDPL
jgi:hypothetical protein